MAKGIKDFTDLSALTDLSAIKDTKVVKEIKEIKNVKGKKWLKEFRDFAVKGNVVDLAVAVAIGAAFGKIVSSFVADIIMPIIGVLIGGIDFNSWKLILREAVLNDKGAIVKQAVTMNIGTFIQNIIDFIIIAWAIFIMVKLINRLKRQATKEEIEEKKEEAPAPLSKDQELLTEIRDLLKKE